MMDDSVLKHGLSAFLAALLILSALIWYGNAYAEGPMIEPQCDARIVVAHKALGLASWLEVVAVMADSGALEERYAKELVRLIHEYYGMVDGPSGCGPHKSEEQYLLDNCRR